MWPYNKIPFSQESILELIMINDYNLDLTLESIKNCETSFLSLVEEKIANTIKINETPTAGKVRRRHKILKNF